MKAYQDWDWLEQKYWGEKLSTAQISELCGVSNSQIRLWMDRLNINYRTFSAANKIVMSRPGIRKKIGKAQLGRHPSKETLEKMSKVHKGQIPWNKGLTKETDKRIINQTEKSQQVMREKRRKGEIKSWNKGKHHTEESKRKMSEIQKRNKYFLGRKHSEKSKRKMSRTRINLGLAKSKNNGRWKGGISFEPYGLEFNGKLKAFIRERDNFTCQMPECGIKENGKNHDCHHIDYDKKNNQPKNFVLLCKKCHAKTNNNRQYWQNYFKEKTNDFVIGASQ